VKCKDDVVEGIGGKENEGVVVVDEGEAKREDEVAWEGARQEKEV
jgi:hypothetical protein